MRHGAILAIDQGTTNTKALLIDLNGRVAARASVALTQKYPRPDWVEQSADEIQQSVRKAIDQCLAAGRNYELLAVAVTNQRETVTAWNRRNGEPLTPAIGWQCRRTSAMCDALRAAGREPVLRQRTGLSIDPLFSGTKLRWLFDNIADAKSLVSRGELCFGTIDSWLLWNLTGGREHACDISNAARTQLFNIGEVEWDNDLLEIFGVPRSALPDARPSSGIFGTTVADGLLPAGIPIAAMAGDSHAALFGQLGFRPGIVKATYGTGSSLMTATSRPVESTHGLSSTIAWQLDGRPPVYALEGNIAVSGAAIHWLGEFLRLENPAEAVAELAAGAEREPGLYIVPAFVGLGAPHWQSDVRGLITGLNLGTRSEHLARATLEAIAYQVRDVFDAMQSDTGRPLEALLADGGASRNEQLMQFQSDIIDRPVLSNQSPELSAIGAAYLAGLAVKLWESESTLEEFARDHRRFDPQMAKEERDTLCEGWRNALLKSRFDSKLMN